MSTPRPGPGDRARGRPDLARLGFADPARADELVTASPAATTGTTWASCSRRWPRPPTRTWPCTAWCAWSRTRRSGSAAPDGSATTAGFASRLVAVLGTSAALADHLAAPSRRLARCWRTTRRSRRAPRRRRCAPGCCAAVGSRSDGLPAHSVGERDAGARRPPGRLPAPAAGPGGARSRRRPGSRRRRRGAGRPRGRDAGRRTGDRPGGGRPGGRRPSRLAVIGMGKCGGRELNYVSDVDVVYRRRAGRGGRRGGRAADGHPAGGGARCGPAPRRPPRARSGRSTRRCARRARPVRWCAPSPATSPTTERWAKTWEFQALLKARPVAGDRELGRQYVDALAPMVWQAAAREGFVDDVQAMRRRVEEQLPATARRPRAQAGPGRPARRRVRRAAAAAGARPQRRDPAQRRTRSSRSGRAVSRRATSGATTPPCWTRRVPVPPLARAPDPAAPAPADPPRPVRRVRPAAARPVRGLPRRPGAGADGDVAAARARGSTAAREAVLPTAAAGRGTA